MAGTINKVILIGHLGDDVKMHYFEGGNSLGRVPLATNESWTNKQTGEKQTRTDWHNLVFKNKGAELVEKYTRKGHKIYVEGKLQTREWTGEDGVKKYTTEVHVFNMTFLQPKGSDNPGSAVDQHQSKRENEKAGDEFLNNQTDQTDDSEPDDLPF